MTHTQTPTPAPLSPDDLALTLRPFAEARMLPRDAYVSDGVLAWERVHLFDGGWVCAGRVDETGRGDANQHAVRVGATGVLVTRASDGAVRAFANVCRHRGHELLPCGASAQRGVIQCPYHAWSYELDGSLRAAPKAGPGLDPSRLGLVPVRHEVWNGWVFVNVDGSAPPFEEHVGGLTDLLAPWQCGRLVVGATHRYDLDANWKIACENYHECYHCPLIHPELSRVSPPESGDNVEDLPGAFVGGTMVLADHATTMSLDGASGGLALPGLSDALRREVMYVNLLPNLLVSLHPDYVMTHRIEPATPRTSRVECQWLFDPDAVARPDFDPGYAVDFWDLTNRQDWQAVESVQRGVDSPRFVPGVFAEAEDAVYHFATALASAYLGGPLTRRSVTSTATSTATSTRPERAQHG
ncbi:MAG TPA: aromatic ring-hydroxylating dioxygenase subunit alpha [Ilumatobacter sp.]|nr:aromatic ring-hydroxylating dioxygenase subunit alpha [Ilumatobacter sp.]